MYKKKMKEILSLVEKNHIDMYFNISKEELDEYVDLIFDENNICNEYDFNYYSNVIFKKVFGRFDSHTKLAFDLHDLYLGLKFKYIDNKLFIIRTTEEDIELLYGEVISIDGVNIDKLVNEIENMTCYSTEGFLIQQIEMSLNNIKKLKSLPSINSSHDEFEFSILKDEKVINKKFGVSDCDFIDLNKPKENYSYDVIEDKIIITYNSCSEKQENQMINFVNEIKNVSSSTDINKFIVDLRGNSGGNSSIIKPLIEFLSDKEVVTLVDQYVFSSGRFAIFDLKNINSVFVGSDIGTTMNCFGNSPIFKYENFLVPISNKYFYMDRLCDEFREFKTKEELEAAKNNNEIFIPQIFEVDHYCKNSIVDIKSGRDKELEVAINCFDSKKVKC